MNKLVAWWLQSRYLKPLVVLSFFLILFGSTFRPLHAVMKDGVFIVAGVLPLIGAWLLGMRLGLLHWVLHSLLLMNLARTVGSSVDDLLTSGIPQYITTFILTSAIGRMSDLTRRLKRELKDRKRIEQELKQYKETLQLKVKERTEDLMRTNQKLELEILENEKINQEKLNLQASLKRAEKMEAVGILAGSVAHDLNNILTGIVSYPELLLMDISEESPLRQPLLTIRNSGQRAAAVVQDLLTLVRKEIINSKVLNLNLIISDFLESPEFKEMAREYPGTTVETDLESELLNIYGSAVHLSKVVMNLVLNSMEAMTRGGRLRISTANVFGKPPGTYEVMTEGTYAVIKFTDTGEGIPKKYLDRIFEPFYTKKIMGRSGTGLGLAIVWGTVKDHKGYIDVQSKEGEGTTFTLFFPATDHGISCEESDPKWEDVAGNGESILIIDDDKLQRQVCTNIFTKMGYLVESAHSGEAAVAFLMDRPVDLIVLDMIMPGGMNGYETYKKIVEIRPGQKAVIVSGFTESEYVKKTQNLGAGAFIKKPYDLMTLGIAVKNELLRD